MVSVAIGENCVHQAFDSKVFLQHKLHHISAFVHPADGRMPVTDVKLLTEYYLLMCPVHVEDGPSQGESRGYAKRIVAMAIHLFASCVAFIVDYYSRKGPMVTTFIRLAGWPELNGE